MAQPMMKEENAGPNAARRKTGIPEGLTPEGFAYAKELERKLGRPLRPVIDGPLTDAEAEEQLLARVMEDYTPIPAEKFLEDFKRLRGEKPQ